MLTLETFKLDKGINTKYVKGKYWKSDIMRKKVEDEDGDKMKVKIVVIISCLFISLIACSYTDAFIVRGESESWDATIDYSIAEDYLEYTGMITFKGEGAVEALSYEINFPPSFGRRTTGSLQASEENQKVFSLGTSGGNHNRDIEIIQEEIQNAAITVSWITKEGEYEETIRFSKEK